MSLPAFLFLQEGRLWLSSVECLVDAYVILLRKLAHAQRVLLSAICLICVDKWYLWLIDILKYSHVGYELDNQEIHILGDAS
jgi:membrane protein YdbS with pleckstrin-like domain